jgi:hypothetical protein
LGFDSRECTPQLVRVAMHVVAEARSDKKAAVLLQRLLGDTLSAKTLERLAKRVGGELREAPQSAPHAVVPEVAVVSSDGGRIYTREPGHGSGVHHPHWRETKCALFEKMSAAEPSQEDPCPVLPDTFRQVAHVAKIAEKAPFQAESPLPRETRYEGPKRVLRTCLSSLVNSEQFGPQMQREAQRRRFYEAPRRVYLGDGLPWNWTLQRTYFPTFTPILDFIHAVQYLYAAAEAWETTDANRWLRYLELAEAVWQGRVGEVIEQLGNELSRRQIGPDAELPDDSPHKPLVTAARYLNNHRGRMDYPRYRREGLPITSAPMESLVKQINHRVKGTEMTWNDPEGAEAILQLRAAALCDDGRLDDYLRHRPGYPLTRRPVLASAT